MGKAAIRMPKLGESAADAAIVAWLVDEGQAVRADQDLLEVETEKSVLTVTAPADGVLTSRIAKPGDRCAVGDLLGQIEVEGQADDAVPAPAPAVTETPAAPPPRPGQPHFPDAETEASIAAGTTVSRVPPPAAAGSGYFSPRVRALMDRYGLSSTDLAAIRGSGRGGRVSTRDVEKFLEHLENERTSPASPMRVAVADSMRRSWVRPLATIACTVHLDPLLAHRRQVAGRPSATVYAIRALALALKADDRPACRLVGDRLVHPTSLDIAFAVEVEDGVRTPVVRAVDTLDLAALTEAYEKALPRSRADLASVDGNAIAAVSNYGTFGITWATPIPLPEQSLILGLGAVENRPDWDPKTGTWARARVCEATLTFDHRVIDGGAAGRLLKLVVDLLQHPERM